MTNSDDDLMHRQRTLLQYKPNKEDLPPQGYRQAGRSQYNTLLQQTPEGRKGRPKRLTQLVQTLGVFIQPLVTIAIAISIMTGAAYLFILSDGWTLQRFVLSDDRVLYLIAVFLFFVLSMAVSIVLPVIVRHLIVRSRGAQSAALTLWITAPDDGKPELGFETEDTAGLKQVLKQFVSQHNYTVDNKSINEMANADLEGTSEESYHIMECLVKENQVHDNLIASERDFAISESDGTNFPLTAITEKLLKFNGTALLQLTIHPRLGDKHRADRRLRMIKGGVDYQLQWFLRRLTLARLEQQQRDEMDSPEQRRYDGLKKTDTDYTYGINIRAVVINNDEIDRRDVQSLFDEIAGSIDAIAFSELEIETETSMAPQGSQPGKLESWKRQKLLERIRNCQYTTRPASLLSVRSKTTSQFITDSTNVWSFQMMGFNNGLAVSREFDVTERDQKPTNRPSEEKMDQFRSEHQASRRDRS